MSGPNTAEKLERPEGDRREEPEAERVLLDQIAEDARREPDRWLREAEVPEGGE